MNEQDLARIKEFAALLRQHPERKAAIRALLTAPEPLPAAMQEQPKTTE